MNRSNSLSIERGVEITERQRAALSSLLAISEKRTPTSGRSPHVSAIGFGGQTDGGSCTVNGGGSTDSSDSTYVLDPLSDIYLSVDPVGEVVVDVVVESVTSTIVDWAPIDSFTGTDSGTAGDFGFVDGAGDSGAGDSGGGDGGGGGDSWGPS